MNDFANSAAQWGPGKYEAGAVKAFLQTMSRAGLEVGNSDVQPDGVIRHNKFGAFQLIQDTDGFMIGRWELWGNSASYCDRWTTSPKTLSAVETVNKTIALKGQSWNAEWATYISENQMQARLSAWSSDWIVQQNSSASWTIYKLIAQGSLNWIYGSPGSLKTFTALDMACSVSAGKSWCGRPTWQGAVIYLSAEGGDDIHLRRKAWEIVNGPAAMLKIISANPLIDDDGTRVLEDAINEAKGITGKAPALIVIDTYAQTSTSDTKEAVNTYTRRLMRVQTAYAPKCAIMVVDHTTKEGGSWMGSQAKLGNVDMMGLIYAKDDMVTLTMRNGKGKIRGAEPFDDIKLKSQVVSLGVKDETGSDRSTLVLAPAKEHSPFERFVLDAIGEGTTYADLQAAFKAAAFNADAKPATVRGRLSRALAGLIALDEIDMEGKDDNSLLRPK